MIKIIKGNAVSAFLDGSVDVLMHCCNDRKVMGSGIAKEIRARVPDAYKNYMAVEGQIQLGTISGTTTGLYNLHAQSGYGRDSKRYINYGAFAECLEQVCQDLFHIQDQKGSGDLTIGVPYLIGCALAGGSWEIVSEILEHYFQGYKLVAYKL